MYATYDIGLGMSVLTPITGVDHLSIRQYTYFTFARRDIGFRGFWHIVTGFGRIFAI